MTQMSSAASPDEAKTIPLTNPDPDATRPSTGGYSSQTAAPLTTAVSRLSGSFSRTIRTRVNLNLPAEAQALDQKLQSSRTSVLSDLVATARHTLPKALHAAIRGRETEARYAVDRPLAAGGMGAVLEITDHDFQRGAAMKVIHGRYATHPDVVERFLAEAQVTAQLEHPNIVPIHDMGAMADGTLYFTMKLIGGDSLGRVVKLLRGKDPAALARWTLEEKILVFLKVLDGVGFANSRGVIHRDLKPDNIMLGEHGEVLVVDWGIAKVLGKADPNDELVRQIATVRQTASHSHTMEGAAMGTIYYMPPEQARGELDRITAASDVYALGATLYELLSLQRPLETIDLQAMVAQVSNGDTIPFSRVAGDLPADVVAIVEKSMRTDPAQRYPDCAGFSADLRQFLAGQAVAARKRNLLERMGAWYGRHRLAVNGSAAAIILFAAASLITVGIVEARTDAAVSKRLEQAEPLQAAGDGNSLRQAAELLTQASALRPDLPEVIERRARVGAALDLIAANEADVRAREAAIERARALVGEAQQLRADGDLAGARERLDAARRLSPADDSIDRERTEVLRLLADAEQAAREREAAQQIALGLKHLEEAEALDPTATTLDAVLSQAEAAFTLSGKDGIAAPGLTAAVDRLAQVRARSDSARTAQRARSEGEALLARAEAAFAAGSLDEARDVSAAAVERLAGRPDAVAVSLRIAEQLRLRQEAAERAAARAAAEKQAEDALAQARIQVAQTKAATTAIQRAREQRQKAGINIEAMTKAQQAEREASRAIAEHWQLAEAAAQSAIAFLGDDRSHASVQAARTLLADLYVGRLQEARTAGRLPEIAAFTNLLARYDDGRYLAEQEARATLTLHGPADLPVQLTALRLGADGRFQTEGAPRAATLPINDLALPAGHWRVSSPHTNWDLRLVPGANALTWIDVGAGFAAAPALAPVPAFGAQPAFLLGRTEITHDEYYRFVMDPAVLPTVLAAYERLRLQLEAGTIPDRPLLLLPRLLPTEREQWQATLRGNRITGFEIPRQLQGLPVSGISRSDAQAYCSWLGTKIGRTVRLPTAAEWRFAADGNDPQRVFPWGDAFDPRFCVTAYDSPPHDLIAQPPGSRPTDRGPFGHLDLAGNVMEWLRNDSGRIGGLVAGGGLSSDQPQDFTTAATTSADTEGVYLPIGFRILVEIPQ